MIIHCTQKLLSELKIKPAEEEAPIKDSLWAWHGNMVLIERRKCVLITNDETLFPVFIPALKKQEFESFNSVFVQYLFKSLLHENIPQNHIEAVLSQSENLTYMKTVSRSVTGCMNEQIRYIQYYIQSEGGLEYTDIYEMNHKLNTVTFRLTGYRHPLELFKEKLSAK